jgi:4-amino-4-deoxy-L-arabinose transferase-like glycosyltransferase
MAAERAWLRPALALVGAVTLLRVALLALNRTDLFVDEAQYWLWAQEPAFGYYSKPPMIAWVIGIFTAACGDSPFCIRLPAPLFNGATALILGAVAARLGGHAVLVAGAWVTLPMVAVASLLISTDTILFAFLALALWAYVACLQGKGAGVALSGGLALGLGFLSKYAAVYLLLCAVLAAPLRPRLSRRQALGFLLGFAVAAAPNVIWNLMNGLATVEHTLDNADWLRDPAARAGLNLAGLAEFFAAQFAVFGPVLFAALLWLGATWRRRDAVQRRWLLFSLPILALVCGQALLSRAYANWAAVAYLAGTLLVVAWLPRRALAVSFAINGVLCLALPVATVFADRLVLNGMPLLARYLGRADRSVAILTAAQRAGLTTVVSGDRDILADLFYTGRASGVTFRALPPTGRAPHHYALRYPYEGGVAPVLLVLPDGQTPPCAAAELLSVDAPESGAYRGKPVAFWQVPGDCLGPG